MPTDVIMPQMGESIFEGTLTKWLKKPGDKVQRDEPLFEISTDKVDAEIPAPTSGVLTEIKVQEGTTVQVNTVVAVIDGDGAAAKPAAKAEPAAKSGAKKEAAPAKAEPMAEAPKAAPVPPPKAEPQAEGTSRATQPQATEEAVAHIEEEEGEEAETESVAEDAARVRSSPLVRRIARDNKVDLSQVSGSGLGGRITKQDITSFLEQRKGAPAAAAPSRPAAAAPVQPERIAPAERAPMVIPGEVVPMSQMRKIIAQRMVESRRTSAHVHSVFEVDVTRIMKLREREKERFQQVNGVKLTVMPFFARAVVDAIRQYPIVNASIEGESIRYHRNINLGIAVALDWGLIVPVLKQAEDLSFVGLQRAITDLGERARAKKLKPDEVQGGTFTITNPGIFGPLFGTPIIVQPQVAILGMGGIFKTPVVRSDDEGNDAIVIRSLIHVVLGYDHRIVDGADADRFLAAVKKALEGWSEPIV